MSRRGPRAAAAGGVLVGLVVGWVTGGVPSVAHFSDVSTATSTSVGTVDLRPAAPTFGTPSCGFVTGTITTVQIRFVAGDRRITSYTVRRTAPTGLDVATVADPDDPGATLTATDSAVGSASATYRIQANNPYGWTAHSPTATVSC